MSSLPQADHSSSTRRPEILIEDAHAFCEVATEQTTGGHVWQAAHTLLDYFEARPSLLAGKPSVIELGAGTGFLGMSLARDFAVSRIILTEMITGGALTWLDRNVQRNRDAGLQLETLSTAALDWSWADEAAVVPAEEPGVDPSAAREAVFGVAWDVVIGSDLVYNEIGVYMLPKVFARLLANGTTIAYYAHTLNRYEFLDRDFFEALGAEGLRCEQVWPDAGASSAEEEGASALADDDEPFSGELFPEQRIVVFCIIKR